jgi:hypothetical protein
MSALDTAAMGPPDHLITSASRPRFACQNPSAITATPASMRTTLRTPGTARAFVSSTLSTVAPKAGGSATHAVSMPGNRTSMPYTPLPSVLDGVSSRFSALPMSLNAEGSLNFGFSGTGTLLAFSASAPYDSRSPLRRFTT